MLNWVFEIEMFFDSENVLRYIELFERELIGHLTVCKQKTY